LKVLRTLLLGLPQDFAQPIVVVLHRHRHADDSLVEVLQNKIQLPVGEALDKEPIRPGHVYVAPSDYHLLLDPEGFSLSTDPPVQYARPSIDVLFESAAENFGAAVVAVILTGANHDGAKGAARIEEMGGMIVVQNPDTAESPVMPLAAIAATQRPHICAPEEMASLLLKLDKADASKSP
jgi:two-component system chemotaxis response regulator CheB